MSKSLISIIQDKQAIDELLDERGGDISEGEIDDIFTEWSVENKQMLEKKIDGYLSFIDSLEAESDALKELAKRRSDQAKVKSNMADRLRDRLIYFVSAKGPLEGSDVIVNVKQGRESVVIDELKDIDQIYLRTKTIIEPDKVKLKEVLKENKDAIRGAHLERPLVLDVKAKVKVIK